MESKTSIIHEPMVPRTFRLLAESEKEGNGLVTYGLKDANDNSFTDWNGSILMDDGRFYELALKCGPEYPQRPPELRFISKINMPFVNQTNGSIIPGSLNYLKNWNRDCTLESYLMAIREEIKTNISKFQQPPENSKFPL